MNTSLKWSLMSLIVGLAFGPVPAKSMVSGNVGEAAKDSSWVIHKQYLSPEEDCASKERLARRFEALYGKPAQLPQKCLTASPAVAATAIWRPLPKAIMTNDLAAVKNALSSNDPEVVNDLNAGLEAAVTNCRKAEIIQALVDAGAEVTEKLLDSARESKKIVDCTDAQKIVDILEFAQKPEAAK